MNTQTMISPTNAMNRVRTGFDRLFENMIPSFVRSIGFNGTTNGPALNMLEDDDRLYVEAELPGVSLTNIDVTVADNTLTISGSRTLSTPDETSTLRQERSNFVFERSIALPMHVEIEAVVARMNNGVLTVTLPKADISRTRRIAVTQN